MDPAGSEYSHESEGGRGIMGVGGGRKIGEDKTLWGFFSAMKAIN